MTPTSKLMANAPEEIQAAIHYSAPLKRFLTRHPEILAEIMNDPFRESTKPTFTHIEEILETVFGVDPRPWLQGSENTEYPSIPSTVPLPDEKHLLYALRRQRNRELIRILARDLADAPVEEVTRELSDLASATLQAATMVHNASLAREFGHPMEEVNNQKQPCKFVVLGMGKLGGRELNYSSDVDIICLYSADEISPKKTSILTNHEYYSRLVERISRALSEPTQDGFVFRVDLDLRPEGKSGPAVNSLPSALKYYESWGQTWERFALLKARPVAGSQQLGQTFLKEIQPFVFRRTLDYTTLETIRDMKGRIDRQARKLLNKKGIAQGFNVKLGKGGIRELEFVVQTMVLLYGGREPKVRDVNTLQTLDRLVQAKLFPSEQAQVLQDAYRHLRKVEHRIQTRELAQTHVIPMEVHEQQRIAASMNYEADNLQLWVEDLQNHRDVVSRAFSDLFAEPNTPEKYTKKASLLLEDPEEARLEGQALIDQLPFKDPAGALENLLRIYRGTRGIESERTRNYIDRLSGPLVEELAQISDPDAALRNLERFLSRVGARSLHLALLAENPGTTKILTRLFGSSDYLSSLFIAHPELLDHLVMTSYGVPTKGRQQLRTELTTSLVTTKSLPPSQRFEAKLDCLRQWRNAEILRVGMADLAGTLTIEGVSRQLSDIADACVGCALEAAYENICCQNETRSNRSAQKNTPGFLIVGLGGLGGREVTFAADVDLLFFYDPAKLQAAGLNPDEDGARLGQRVITALCAPTKHGIAFRVDTRLRPSGTAGPLAVSTAAFKNYHKKDAELWERMALLRARPIAGDSSLWKDIRPLIRGVGYHFDTPPKTVAKYVQQMRQRLESESDEKAGKTYDLKFGMGGLLDLEFLVQALQLVHGPGNRALRSPNTPDALRQLEAAGHLTRQATQELVSSYRFFRLLENRLRIVHDQPISQIPRDLSKVGRLALRSGFGRQGTPLLQAGKSLLADYKSRTTRVRKIFNSLLEQISQ